MKNPRRSGEGSCRREEESSIAGYAKKDFDIRIKRCEMIGLTSYFFLRDA